MFNLTSFDLISDLYLTSEDKFNWEGKATSLFCVVAGNVSDDLVVLQKTLTHLATHYQGVFYIDGSLEYPSLEDRNKRLNQIERVVGKINKTVYLHDNVVVVNNVAIVGLNGWYGNTHTDDPFDELRIAAYRTEDMAYLTSTLKRLQLHLEVDKILIVSNCIPSKSMLFGEDKHITDSMSPALCLAEDTESKVTNWVFGSSDKMVDTTQGGIKYVSNPYDSSMPYWAKRIELD